MVRYSFPVGLLHPRLPAGLSRRFRFDPFLPSFLFLDGVSLYQFGELKMNKDEKPRDAESPVTGDTAEFTDEALDQSGGGITGDSKTIIGGFKSMSGVETETDAAGVTVRGWDPKQHKAIIGEAE